MTSLPTRSAIALVLWAALAPAQTTITLEGVTHRLNPHPRVFFDGPSGTITSSVRDPDGTGPAVAAKANTGNPTWASLINRSNFWKGFGAYNDPAFTIDHTGGQQVALYAMRWYSDNSQTAYRTAALYMLNHIEQYYPTICDETMSNCIWAGGTGYYVTSYGVIYWNQQWLFAYELMRGEMTEQERRDFASKFLNDIAAFGGVTGSPATSCTNPSANAPGTVSVAGGVITSTAPLFGPGNPIQAGDWVAENSTNGSSDPSKVMTIIDETHATVSSRQAGSWNGFSGKLAYRRLQWQDGDCGILWVGKHGPFGPRSVIHVGGSTAYPPGGGSVMDYSSNNTFAMFGQMMAVYLSLADDDANADLRSQAQLTALYHEWYANIWSTYIQHGYTGFHYTGSAYGLSRPFDTAQIPAMMSWSIDGQAPALAGTWVQNFLYHYFMNWIPSCATAELQWGQDFGLINGFSDPNTMYHAAVAYAFTRNTNEGQWFNWALRNRLANCGSYGVNPGTSLFWTPSALSGASINALDQWLYAYTDPTWPSMDLSASGPTAAALNRVDAESGAYPQSALISRTGYNSMTDTLVNFYGFYEKWGDH